MLEKHFLALVCIRSAVFCDHPCFYGDDMDYEAQPNFDLNAWVARLPFKDKTFMKGYINDLGRLASLHERSPIGIKFLIL